MKITIRNKLLAGFIGLIIMIVISQLVFNLFFAKVYYTNEKEKAMATAFTDFKTNYDGTIESIINSANKYEDHHNIIIHIFSGEEHLYNSEENFPFSKDPKRNSLAKGLENAVYLENPRVNTRNNDQQRSFMSLFGKFDFESEEIFVSMSLPTASIDSSVAIFTKSSTMILSVFLFVGIIVSFIIAKSITKPIEDIEKITLKLSKLDFSDKTDETVKTKEIASLASNINIMSSQLEGSISSLNQANKKLKKDVDYQKQIEQMRREFVANVSHEMKTPLALLQLYSENLKNNIENIDRDYYCETIIEETEYLNKMVKSMLDISAIESGVSRLLIEEFNLSQLCTSFVDKMRPMLEPFKVNLVINEEVNINADPKLIEQVMRNYLTNAITHTAKGDEIKIELSRINNKAIFSVYNQGEQITKEHQENIWNSFYKSDKARVRTTTGNVGLGLYIVKTIIEKHSGNYYVENKDNGVSFSFALEL